MPESDCSELHSLMNRSKVGMNNGGHSDEQVAVIDDISARSTLNSSTAFKNLALCYTIACRPFSAWDKSMHHGIQYLGGTFSAEYLIFSANRLASRATNHVSAWARI